MLERQSRPLRKVISIIDRVVKPPRYGYNMTGPRTINVGIHTISVLLININFEVAG
jgi:hypothetical protein